MPDVFTKSKRSEVMSRIRSRGNKATELRLIEIFRTHEFTGWRRNQKLFGKPDFVFRSQRVCVFVDGCFWHGCPKHGTRPKQNRKFWDAKLQRNEERDHEVDLQLRKAGWRVLRIWEHELARKNEMRLAGRIRKLIDTESCRSAPKNIRDPFREDVPR